ncbi:type II toxin-antitoxin system RelE/ParE family toxin [Actinomyces ruminicola]|uniref:type II toxin-antitoxin system RelE/ParE family toxin n=1 Tax=Actinomyces ruminicola TaxID=332524 RepID=UPI000B873612
MGALTIYRTRDFDRWLRHLRDTQAKARVLTTLRRWTLTGVAVGDIKPVGGGVAGARVQTGPGYRVYFAQHGSRVVLLLLGGSKGGQRTGISKARTILENLRRAGDWT